MRLGPLLHILCIASNAGSDESMRPLDSSLAPSIVNLPHLHVEYNRTYGLAPFRLHGASVPPVKNEESPWLKSAPIVRWPMHNEHASDTLVFVDLGPEEKPSKFFPFVHSLWTQCSGSLASCRLTVIPYLPPGNVAVIPNRYTFILFRRGAPHAANRTLVLNGKRYESGHLEKRPPKLPGFSFTRMLRENVGLEAVSYNFLYVRGQGGGGGRRRGRRTRRGRL